MRRLAIIAFGFLLTLSMWGPALAQLQNPVMRTPWNPFKAGGGGGGPTYVGPCDLLTTVTACYCLRACTAAAAAGHIAAINLIRASDSATQDILVKSDGTLDVASAATFCASTTCFGDNWYDQANGFTTVAIANQQPTFVFNCVGALPCFRFNPINGSSGQCFSIGPNGITASFPSSFFIVSRPNSSQFSSSGVLLSIGSSNMQSEYGVVANQFSLYNGARLPSGSTSSGGTVYDNASIFDNDGSSEIIVNNSLLAVGNAGTHGAATTNLRIGAVNGGGGCEFPIQGDMMEAIYAQYQATPTQITAVYNNEFTYGWH